MNLDELRKEIDACDRQMVTLFEKRQSIAKQVAEYKITTGKKVYDPEREKQKIEAVKGMTHNAFNQKGIEALFEQLMAISRKLQYQQLAKVQTVPYSFIECEKSFSNVKVLFQGDKGSFSEAAMIRYFGTDIDAIPVTTFKDTMSLLDKGEAEYAILPIENSTTGILNEIYDLLATYNLTIVGEQVIEIEQCLLGGKDTTLNSIKTVYSHPQSLLQTEGFLKKHSSWQQISMQNNAFAAAKVANDGDITQAAIAGEHAAIEYGLVVLQKGINDIKGNSTRFIIISHERKYFTTASKISISFEIPHEAGSLYRVLSHFIYNDLNMTKIESRPLQSSEWEYRFFIDFEGNLKDSAVINALTGIMEETRNFRILGNYESN